MKIFGIIKNSENKEPIQGAKIKIKIKNQDVLIASVDSDKDGKYEIPIEKHHSGQILIITIEKDVFKPRQTEITIHTDTLKDFELNPIIPEPKFWIYGTIRNSKNNAPVQGANIELKINNALIASIYSDEHGKYEYSTEKDYTGQTLDIIIEKDGFESRRTEITTHTDHRRDFEMNPKIPIPSEPEAKSPPPNNRKWLMIGISILALAVLIGIIIWPWPHPVQPRHLANITVSPKDQTLTCDQPSQQFTATGIDNNGNNMNPQNLLWNSNNATVGTINAASGVFMVKKAGYTKITATSGGKEGSTILTVSPGQLASINIITNPVLSPSWMIWRGQNSLFTAIGKDSCGNNIPITPNWISTNTGVGTIDGTGEFTAKNFGRTYITAQSGGKLDTVQVRVCANGQCP